MKSIIGTITRTQIKGASAHLGEINIPRELDTIKANGKNK
jgi:hypothetical protein